MQQCPIMKLSNSASPKYAALQLSGGAVMSESEAAAVGDSLSCSISQRGPAGSECIKHAPCLIVRAERDL